MFVLKKMVAKSKAVKKKLGGQKKMKDPSDKQSEKKQHR